MSKNKTDLELIEHKQNAVNEVDDFLNSLISSESPIDKSKADKLSYWLEDYIRFLRIESEISSAKFKRYKRGQVIKVHLGFNVGSEEGGLHYALVISNNDSIKSSVVHIVPLTSIKDSTDLNSIRADRGQIVLGNELYRLLFLKVRTLETQIDDEINDLEKEVTTLTKDDPKKDQFQNRIILLKRQSILHAKMVKEINKMKKGSIALVGQITTVSKIRIFDPKTNKDVLSNIRMSNETMNKIDGAIERMFTYQPKSDSKICEKS